MCLDSWCRVPLTTCTVSVESFQTHCHQSMQLPTKWNTDLLRVSPVCCLLDGNRPRANSLRHYITWRDRCRNRTRPLVRRWISFASRLVDVPWLMLLLLLPPAAALHLRRFELMSAE